MKKNFLVILLAVFCILCWSAPQAMAQTVIGNENETNQIDGNGNLIYDNDYGSYTYAPNSGPTYNEGGEGGTGIGVGIAGANADANAEANAGAAAINNVGNGLGNFSPSASNSTRIDNRDTNLNTNVGINTNVNDVDIRNRNINVNAPKATIERGAVQNRNLNAQGQLQGQIQGQMQGQIGINKQQQNNNQTIAPVQTNEQSVTVDTEAIGEGMKYAADKDFEARLAESKANSQAAADENETALKVADKMQPKRAFVNPSQPAPNPDIPDYHGDFMPGPQVLKVQDIVKYQHVFMYDDLQDSKWGMHERVRIKYRPLATSDAAADRITVLLDDKPIQVGTKRLLGFMYAQAVGDEADTVLVMQEALDVACSKGGNVAVLVGEGYTTDTQAFGWGIGLSYTQAVISNDQRSSGAGAGGTGISGVKTGPEIKPWMQFAIFEWSSK